MAAVVSSWPSSWRALSVSPTSPWLWRRERERLERSSHVRRYGCLLKCVVVWMERQAGKTGLRGHGLLPLLSLFGNIAFGSHATSSTPSPKERVASLHLLCCVMIWAGKTKRFIFCPCFPSFHPPLSPPSFNTFPLPLLQSPNDFASDYNQTTPHSSYLPNDTSPASADGISLGRPPPPPSAYLVYDAVWAAALAFTSSQHVQGSSLKEAMGLLNFTGVSVSSQWRLLTEEQWLLPPLFLFLLPPLTLTSTLPCRVPYPFPTVPEMGHTSR